MRSLISGACEPGGGRRRGGGDPRRRRLAASPCRRGLLPGSPTVVEVETEALGLSAEEMEQLITVPLEQDLLNAWPGWTIRSQSVPGLSSIVMEFEPGTDLYRARQVVQERLNGAHTPDTSPRSRRCSSHGRRRAGR